MNTRERRTNHLLRKIAWQALALFIALAPALCTADENPFLAQPSPRTQYEREDFRAKYSLEKLEEAVDFIRDVTGPTDDGPLLKSKVADAVRRSDALRAECKRIADNSTFRIELRCLANTALWLGGEGARLSAALAQYRAIIGTQTRYDDHECYYEPLLAEWLREHLSADEFSRGQQKYADYARPGITPVRDYNNPPAVKLLGLMWDPDKQERTFYGGAVFGEPTQWDPGAVAGHRQNLTYQSLVQPEGPNVEGLYYSGYHTNALFFYLCYRELTGQDVFRLSYFQNWPLWFAYLSGNGFEFLDYETHDLNRNYLINGQNFYPTIALYELGLTRTNRELAGLCKSWIPIDKHRNLGGANLPVWLLYEALRDPDLPLSSKTTLPLTHVFQNRVICSRSSWESPDATVLIIKAPLYPLRNAGAIGDITVWSHGAMVLPKHLQVHDYGGGVRSNNILLYRAGAEFVEWGPPGAIDNASQYLASSQFGKDGPSYAEILNLKPRDALESVTDSAEELRVELAAVVEFRPTASNPNDQNAFSYSPPFHNLMRELRTTIIWRKKSNVILLRHRLALEQGDQAHLRINFQDEPDVTRHRYTAVSKFSTEHNNANAKIVWDILRPEMPDVWETGGYWLRNAGYNAGLRRAHLPPSITSLPQSDWRNQICGMHRMQIPSEDGEWLLVGQLLSADEEPKAVSTRAIVVGNEAISYSR